MVFIFKSDAGLVDKDLFVAVVRDKAVTRIGHLKQANPLLARLADLYRSVWKPRNHIQFAAHGLDVATQGERYMSVRFSILGIDGCGICNP